MDPSQLSNVISPADLAALAQFKDALGGGEDGGAPDLSSDPAVEVHTADDATDATENDGTDVTNELSADEIQALFDAFEDDDWQEVEGYLDLVEQRVEAKAGGADRNRGGADKLRRYWLTGAGGAKIGWGTDGDFTRCVGFLSEHMTPERAKGYCANRHKEATGMWPGDKGNKSVEQKSESPRATRKVQRAAKRDARKKRRAEEDAQGQGPEERRQKRDYERDNIGRFGSGTASSTEKPKGDKPKPKNPGGGKTVKIKEGETLSEIALRELGDASRWKEILEASGLDLDPRKIPVGTEFTLPDDKPKPSREERRKARAKRREKRTTTRTENLTMTGTKSAFGNIETKDSAMQMEHKVVPVMGQKVLDEAQGIVETIVSVTGLVDEVRDNILPGAYEKTLATRTPKGVWGHDWMTPVSKTLQIKELKPGDPELPETTRDGSPWPAEAGGLKVKTQFNLETQRGKDAYSDVKFYGVEQEWSIGYQVPVGGSTMNTKTGTREIKTIDLYEYSPVLFGAMPMAMSTSVKSAQTAYRAIAAAPVGTETKEVYTELAGSVEQMINDVRRAVREAARVENPVAEALNGSDASPTSVAFDDPFWTSVEATYPDRVVYTRYNHRSDSRQTFEVDYTWDDGEVTLGEPREVEVVATIVPVEQEDVRSAVAAVADVPKALYSMTETKAGRVLSSANVVALEKARDSIDQVIQSHQSRIVPPSGDGTEEKSAKDDLAKIPRKFVRDRNGRFARIGDLVDLGDGGGKGTIEGVNDDGTARVKKDDGSTVDVSPKELTGKGKPSDKPSPGLTADQRELLDGMVTADRRIERGALEQMPKEVQDDVRALEAATDKDDVEEMERIVNRLDPLLDPPKDEGAPAADAAEVVPDKPAEVEAPPAGADTSRGSDAGLDDEIVADVEEWLADADEAIANGEDPDVAEAGDLAEQLPESDLKDALMEVAKGKSPADARAAIEGAIEQDRAAKRGGAAEPAENEPVELSDEFTAALAGAREDYGIGGGAVDPRDVDEVQAYVTSMDEALANGGEPDTSEAMNLAEGLPDGPLKDALTDLANGGRPADASAALDTALAAARKGNGDEGSKGPTLTPEQRETLQYALDEGINEVYPADAQKLPDDLRDLILNYDPDSDDETLDAAIDKIQDALGTTATDRDPTGSSTPKGQIDPSTWGELSAWLDTVEAGMPVGEEPNFDDLAEIRKSMVSDGTMLPGIIDSILMDRAISADAFEDFDRELSAKRPAEFSAAGGSVEPAEPAGLTRPGKEAWNALTPGEKQDVLSLIDEGVPPNEAITEADGGVRASDLGPDDRFAADGPTDAPVEVDRGSDGADGAPAAGTTQQDNGPDASGADGGGEAARLAALPLIDLEREVGDMLAMSGERDTAKLEALLSEYQQRIRRGEIKSARPNRFVRRSKRRAEEKAAAAQQSDGGVITAVDAMALYQLKQALGSDA